jgi:hypothetical protein
MTARYLMMLALALGMGGFAAGCSGDGEKPTPTGDDDDDDDDDDVAGPTGPTGETNDFFNPRSLFIYGQFGYDSVARAPATVDLAGYALIPPTYEIYLASATWQNDLNDVNNYCYIIMSLENAGASAVATADPRLYYGAQYNPADGYVTNCHEAPTMVDPAAWGDDVGLGFVGYYEGDYFAAVGDPSTTIANDVIPQFPADDQGFVIGGALGVPYFLGYQVDDIYGFAWGTDANMVVQLDANMYLQPLQASSVNVGGNIATAWYELNSYIYWQFR